MTMFKMCLIMGQSEAMFASKTSHTNALNMPNDIKTCDSIRVSKHMTA